jgi:hypothetical protein
MTRLRFAAICTLLTFAVLLLAGFGFDHDHSFWSQWGRDAQHTGRVDVLGQPLDHKLADIFYDPFVEQEKAENVPIDGEAVLTAHYQSTLIDGDSFYMIQKTGTYPSCNPAGEWFFGADCGPNAWGWLNWNVARYDWTNGEAVQAWIFPTDWKPANNGSNINIGAIGLDGWEPVFHPALSRGHLYVPGAGGTLWKVDLRTGVYESHINPFAGVAIDPALTFVTSPLTASDHGDIYYNVIELANDPNPWQGADIAGAWLVKVRPDDSTAIVTYQALVPNAPAGTAFTCPVTFFDTSTLPWPPSPSAKPINNSICGSQRPPVNLAPAVARDGTIYTASVAHFDNMVTYFIAVNPDLTPKWAASMQHRLTDGCGVLLPIAAKGVLDEPNSCRFGTKIGVDPTTNAKGSATMIDEASSTPTVLPDGSIVLGVTDNYNYARGHLMHFDPDGNFLNAYTFGWDTTPAVYEHDGTFSIVVKDNHYPEPAYCFGVNSPVCTPVEARYYVSQVNPQNMQAEWSFQSTTIDSAHPHGYEWCVNAPVIDRHGVVYITSEDGHVYSVDQGHTGVFTKWRQKIFLLEALGAAYTPMAIGEDGKEYSQNNGHLFVIGK